MDAGSSTVLVTGGGSGIGLALAERFHRGGARVLVCGRREARLREAAARLPGLETRVCDLARPEEREALRDWALARGPALNVLVNNAGIQRRFRVEEPEPWPETAGEIAINLDAPVHLSLLFLPHLLRAEGAAIVNVTSGLAFAPMAAAPVYSATKAALHSFTLSLRRQLRDSGVEVVEIIPPAVDTDLGGPGLHTFGAPVDAFADSVMERLLAGEREIPYGSSERNSRASRAELDEIFEHMNARSG